MVNRCNVCKARTRADGTCTRSGCSLWRAGRRGKHWKVDRLGSVLRKAAERLGAYVTGGHIVSLQHRHDIRVGIASGMFLRRCSIDSASRIQLLTLLFPCYWKWSTKMLLEAMARAMTEIRSSQPLARATLLQHMWDRMEGEMQHYQVVGWPQRRSTELMTRADARNPKRRKQGAHAYHPYMNPAGRRNGREEFGKLLGSVRDGSLWRHCVALAKILREGEVTYAAAAAVVRQTGVELFVGKADKDARYTRTRQQQQQQQQ